MKVQRQLGKIESRKSEIFWGNGIKKTRDHLSPLTKSSSGRSNQDADEEIGINISNQNRPL